MTKLVVFDLDQTLIDVLPAHDRAISAAFREVFGVSAKFSEVDFAGRQMDVSLLEMGELHDIGRARVDAQLGRLKRIYAERFPGEVAKRPRLLPGVREVLHRLRLAGVRCAINTGGRGLVAKEMLRRMGLSLSFYPVVSSDDADDRQGMIRLTMRKAAKRGERIKAGDVVVVGDSVHDVVGAKKVGARSIAVLTGPQSRARLQKKKPDYIFKNLASKGVWEALTER